MIIGKKMDEIKILSEQLQATDHNHEENMLKLGIL
jgi:hypothetical protein